MLLLFQSVCAFGRVVDFAVYRTLQRIGVAGFGNRQADRWRFDLFRREQLDGQCSVGNPRLNLNIVIGVVLELEIFRAVVNTGIASHRTIVDLLRMRVAFDDGAVGEQGGVEHGGCDLADAAADLLRSTGAAGKDSGGLVALFRCAHAECTVEGEGFARLEDGTVDGFARNIEIGRAVYLRGFVLGAVCGIDIAVWFCRGRRK